jgi:hypothetical protein
MVDVINILVTWLIDLINDWQSVLQLCGNNSKFLCIKKYIQHDL